MSKILRVLNVEDSEQDASLLRIHLTKAGYALTFVRVETAADMKSALDTSEWDIVLTDYSMPQFNAIGALAILKESGLDIPFIIISGSIGEAFAVEVMLAGANDYMMKDNLMRLVPAIERELQDAENRRARRLAEKELRESEESYRFMFENNPLPMWIFDIESLAFLAVNEAAIKHYGYSREEFLTMTIKEIRPPEDVPAFIKYLYAVSGEVRKGNIVKHLKKDGSLIDVEVTSHMSLVFAGGKARIVLVHDVTERMRAEKVLVEWKNRYEAAINASGQILYDWDPVTNEVTFGGNFQDVLGYTEEEMEGGLAHWIELIHEEDVEAFNHEIRRVIETHEPLYLKYRVKRKDDSYIFVEDRGYFFVNAQGMLASMVGFIVDITDRVKAEEALKQAEKRYRSIFENAVEGIFQSTPGGRFTVINPAMVKMFGFESEDDLMTNRTDIATQHYVDPTRRAELQHLLARDGIVVGFECEVYRKDRTKIWTRENTRAIRDKNGTILYYEGSIEDISEKKLLESQLFLSQKLEGIGRLAGGIAHDFNNLLTAIIGYSVISLGKLHEADPLYYNITEIRKAADRAASLTRQLLAFSRKQILQLRILNLNDIVLDIDKMLHRLMGADIELHSALSTELGNVKADPGQIEQVIMNLAINAGDAMPNGGKLTIETANVYLDKEYANQHIAVIPGHYVLLAVSDTGTGMDAETQSNIFEPFFTTKELGKGTGLGLSTVYGIVKQSGGNIWVYSEVGEGTTFKIYLPRVDEEAEQLRQVISKQEMPKGTETVLIAEDDESVRKLARVVLETSGYKVLEANNGGVALSICEQYKETIHLLLTDVVMPEMSGTELVKRLTKTHPKIRVLYMSGYTDNAIVHRGILKEGMTYIQKPFAPGDLAKKVREILDAV